MSVLPVFLYAQEYQLQTGFYSVAENDSCTGGSDYLKLKSEDGEFCINKNPIVTENDFDSVKVVKDMADHGVEITLHIKLKSSAIEDFKNATGKLVGKRLAIVVNDKVIAAPVLRDPIESGEIAVFCDEKTMNEVKEAFHLQ
jgi:preprotein translocase subunit SecD